MRSYGSIRGSVVGFASQIDIVYSQTRRCYQAITAIRRSWQTLERACFLKLPAQSRDTNPPAEFDCGPIPTDLKCEPQKSAAAFELLDIGPLCQSGFVFESLFYAHVCAMRFFANA